MNSVEKFITFTLNDGQWDIQLWPGSYKPLAGKVYKISVPVPAELIGATIIASVEDAQ